MSFGHLSIIKGKKYGFGWHLNDKQGKLLASRLVIGLLTQDAPYGNHYLLIIANEQLFIPMRIKVIHVFYQKNGIVHVKNGQGKRIILNVSIIHYANDVQILSEKQYRLAKTFYSMKFVSEW